MFRLCSNTVLIALSILLCILSEKTLSIRQRRYIKFNQVTKPSKEWEVLVPSRFIHAESPVWDGEKQMLYWVDALNQTVNAFDYRTKTHAMKRIEYGEVNIVLPVENTSRVLVAVRAQLFLLDWTKPGDKCLRYITAVDQGNPDNTLNDAKCDAKGRFWGGTKGPHINSYVMPSKGAFYSIEQPDFTPKVHIKPVSISNGLTWSLNGSVLFYADSGTKKIEAFDFDLRRGILSRRRTITNLRGQNFADGIADGMAIDRDGLLWVAIMFAGTIARINPDTGIIMERYDLPVDRVTSIAWAGPHLDQLIVTTSQRDMTIRERVNSPYSGAIIVMRNLGTRGVPTNKCVFDDADSY